MWKIKYVPYKILLNFLSYVLSIYVKIAGKSFYCNALSGESSYNITVNSDMTVSCNCSDRFALGRIGDLSKESLQDIFSGKRARFFRRLLHKGKIPILNCLVCKELHIASKNVTKELETNYKIPHYGIMVENTANCNLRCLSCKRKLILSNRDKNLVSEEDVKRISSTLEKNNIERLNFYNLGEPFLSKNVKKELEMIRSENPDIFIDISTNGTMVNTKEKREAAMIADNICFSIHGSTQHSAARYQRGTDFEKAYRNMKSLVKFRNSLKRKKPTIIWKYVLFHWNEKENLIKRSIKLAKDADIDSIFFELTFSPIYGIAWRHYLGIGYLNRISKRDGIQYHINLEEVDV